MSNAAVVVESTVRLALMKATPSLVIGLLGCSRFSMPVMAAATSSAWSALATTITGSELSARPWAVSTFWPVTESNSLV